MDITRRIRAYFSRKALASGRASFEAGRGHVVKNGAGRIRVRVEDDGGASAVAELAGRGNLLQASCTCPAFDLGYRPCGHILTAVLLADAQGLLVDLPSSGSMRIATGPSPSRIEALAAGELPVSLEGVDAWRPAEGRPAAAILPSASPEAEEPPRDPLPLPEVVEPGKPAKRERPSPLEPVCLLDVDAASPCGPLVIEIMGVKWKRDGSLRETLPLPLKPDSLEDLPDHRHRDLLRALAVAAGFDLGAWTLGNAELPSRFTFERGLSLRLLRKLAKSGCPHLRRAGTIDPDPVEWDEWPYLNLGLCIARAEDGRDWMVRGFLVRGGDCLELKETLVLPGGFALVGRSLCIIDSHGVPSWLDPLRSGGVRRVPREEEAKLLDALWNLPVPRRIDWPDELRFEEVHPTPRPRLTIRPALPEGDPRRLRAWLAFSYDGVKVASGRRGQWIIDPPRRRGIARNWKAEWEAAARLRALGFQQSRDRSDTAEPHDFELRAKRLPGAVRALAVEDWTIEAEGGRLYRRPGNFWLFVSSGVDWFSLEGGADFEGIAVELPDILKAIRSGEKWVLLGDGSIGMLPEEWLEKFGLLASLGTADRDDIRFLRSQARLLDALLRGKHGVRWDEGFERARKELLSFDRIAPLDPPPTFAGTLRPYQKEGLGWLGFLRRFGLGG